MSLPTSTAVAPHSTQSTADYKNSRPDDRIVDPLVQTTGPLVQTGNGISSQASEGAERQEWSGSSARTGTDVNQLLVGSWFKISIDLMLSDDDKWLHKSIEKSQKYALALYGNEEYRNFITSYVLILRNNSSNLGDSQRRDLLKRALDTYANSTHTRVDRIQFLRTARTAGLSPTGA